jgi:hypothetical protein
MLVSAYSVCEKVGVCGEKKPSFVSPNHQRLYDLGLLNSSGIPRRFLARRYFEENRLDLSLLVDLYRLWRDQKEYVLFRKIPLEPTKYSRVDWRIGLCSKRGNPVHAWRLRKRLGWMDEIENEQFFKDEDMARGKAYSPILFATLTYDTKRCSKDEAWQNIGLEYDRWIHVLRRKFGRISVFRVFQIFDNGYPHIHVLLVFHERKFRVSFKTNEYDPYRRRWILAYRIAEKESFEDGWHSFVDVCSAYCVRGAVKYAKRYMTKKKHENDKTLDEYTKKARGMQYGDQVSDLDLAVMWLYGKRSFAVSEDFKQKLHEFIRSMHNSDKRGDVQTFLETDSLCFLPKPLYRYELVGIFSARELEVTGDDWWGSLDVNQSPSLKRFLVEVLARHEAGKKMSNYLYRSRHMPIVFSGGVISP